MTTTAAERGTRRAAGPLYPCGKCHYCGFTVPPKAHWCSTGCADLYTAETRQLEQVTKGSNGID